MIARLRRIGHATLIVTLLCGVQQAHLVSQEQNDAADAARLIELLDIHEGARVADIGAGSGLLTIPIARAAGPTGRVYATDIDPRRLAELRQISLSRATNVRVIEGGSTTTALPGECCEAIFMRHVYHHVGDTAAMNASLLRSLTPGGKIVIVDFPPRSGTTAPAGCRESGTAHGVMPMTVVEELSAAGFIRVLRVAWPSSGYFAVVAERP